jgi:TRAP-type C4-dicarboxylate transport system substrate-binding protein
MKPTVSLKVARAVYDQVPYMSKVFEDKHRQKLLSLIADNGYNLGTNFEWNEISQIKGQKIAGAGLNLKWLEFVGATPVQSTLVDAYTSMQTGVYNGWIMFPSGWISARLYEVGKFYTEIGFGAITWHGLTVNTARWNRIPKEVQDVILEVAREYEAKTGTFNEENYPKQLEQLRGFGVNVRQLPDKVREDWASSLAEWPKQKAQELDKQGLPGTQVLEIALGAAEKNGHKWPVRYKIK